MDLLHVDFAHRVRLEALLVHRFGLSRNEALEEELARHGFSWDTRLTKDDLPKLAQLAAEQARAAPDAA